MAGLLPGLVAGRVTKLCRDVECYFSAAADSNTLTCQTFADHWFITLADFQRTNPGVNCANLDINTSYCVHGDVTPEPSSSSSISIITASSSSSSTPLSTATSTRILTVISPTPSAIISTRTSTTIQSSSTSAPSPSISPILPGVAGNCNRFYQVASGDECDIVSQNNGITTAQLRSGNDINASCSNLWLGYYVCVGIPGVVPSPTTTSTSSTGPTPTVSPAMPGYASNCNRWEKLRSWNTQINAQCNNLWLDYYVCVGIPGVTPSPTTSTTSSAPTPTISPVMPSHVSNCNPLEQGPLRRPCSNLWLGYYICAGVPVTPPSPLMPGAVSTCNRWHLIASGDQCDNIASRNSIFVAQF
ncbi:hypothetical protein QBC36DRAFT_300928 [Triangularia setosa]|uniref:LysM domain-containing protein n=1 Tax=Triangularia setosa TaxID=2587417 RepID=A0AAN7A7Z0_9PEZI|nr:hypothetical protein QBC36DRAFT_300928 [Podospora setosa]